MAMRQRLPLFARALAHGLARSADAGKAAPGAQSLAQAAVVPVVGLRARLCLGAWRGFASYPEHTELRMPALSPTMEQGNILEWKKKVGDSIAPGDVYCEVETDKASMEWESQEEGFLAKIIKGDGSKDLPVGQVVAVLCEDENDVAAFKDWEPSAEDSKLAPAAATAEALAPKKSEEPKKKKKKAAAAKAWPAHQVLTMPALSPTMEQGNILEWKKKEGDTVAPGDVWAEVETDKASMDWESQEEGVVAKILLPSHTSGVSVGSPVVVLVEEGEDIAPFADFSAADAEGGAAAAAEPEPEPEPEAAPAAAPADAKKPAAAAKKPASAGGRIRASPYAKRLAAEAGVSLEGAAGSGEDGRITAVDVQALIKSGAAAPATGAAAPGGPADAYPAPAAEGGYTDVQNTQIRKVTARRLLESKQQVPHYYLTVSVRVDAAQALRASLNASLAASGGGKLSLNDLVIKASALTLRKFPQVNASWYPEFIREYHDVDVSVAVQTPAGLMVPIVRDADLKGLAAISADVKSLAAKAKEGKLRPDEFTGGSFTISNLGMYGVSQFAAIINPPQACILAVGTTEPRVIKSAATGAFEEAQFMQVTLSCDHRVVDGALGAQWLQAFKAYMEDPASMLL